MISINDEKIIILTKIENLEIIRKFCHEVFDDQIIKDIDIKDYVQFTPNELGKILTKTSKNYIPLIYNFEYYFQKDYLSRGQDEKRQKFFSQWHINNTYSSLINHIEKCDQYIFINYLYNDSPTPLHPNYELEIYKDGSIFGSIKGEELNNINLYLREITIDELLKAD